MKKLILVALSLVIVLSFSSLASAQTVMWTYFYYLDGTYIKYDGLKNPNCVVPKDGLFSYLQQKDEFFAGVWNYEWVLHPWAGTNVPGDMFLRDFGVSWYRPDPTWDPTYYNNNVSWSYSYPAGNYAPGYLWAGTSDPNKYISSSNGDGTFYAGSLYAPGDVNIVLSTFRNMSDYSNWEKWAGTDIWYEYYKASGPIPEPGTLLLLGSGLVGFGVIARIRRKRS